MSYEKQAWETGDVITKEKLNHMEDGIGSCVIYFEALPSTTSINESYIVRQGENTPLTIKDFANIPWGVYIDKAGEGRNFALLADYGPGIDLGTYRVRFEYNDQMWVFNSNAEDEPLVMETGE